MQQGSEGPAESPVGRRRRFATWARRNAIPLGLGAIALAVSGYYLAVVVKRAGAIGFPIDDSYIYLTYAKQVGRGQPFTYFQGSGYSAGATSPLWPIVLGPLWTIGFRGVAFVAATFAVCAALLALTTALAARIGAITVGRLGGVIGAVLIVSSAPLTWTALSGMEVGFAAALLFAAAMLLIRDAKRPHPSAALLVALAAASLARPEALALVGLAVAGCAIDRIRQRQWRAAALYGVSLAPALLWLSANKLLAGQLSPNTAVAKSHFYLPGFDWAYYSQALADRSHHMIKALFWSSSSPLPLPRLLALAWLIGAARLLVWARRERTWAGPVLLVLAAPVLLAAVIASSGAWDFHNYRYVAAGFPALFLVAGLAIPDRLPGARLGGPLARRAWPVLALAAVLALVASRAGSLQGSALFYAQGVRDSNAQTVKIGRWIAANLPPDAHVAFHDAGAIAYYGDRRFTDILGLISNRLANYANQGPGVRLELLDSLPPDRRPTHFAYYPGWMGTRAFWGDLLLRTPIPPPIYKKKRLVGGSDMQVFKARWDMAGSGDTPIDGPAGWSVVDRLDVADLASEAAHGYRADQGRRRYGDPTARWSLAYEAEVGQGDQRRPIIDGGRVIRGPAGERFTIEADPALPLRLVVRSGGDQRNPWSKVGVEPVEVTVRRADTGAPVGALVFPAPASDFVDLTLEIPADPGRPRRLPLAVTASAPYRTFHWFALQPIP